MIHHVEKWHNDVALFKPISVFWFEPKYLLPVFLADLSSSSCVGAVGPFPGFPLFNFLYGRELIIIFPITFQFKLSYPLIVS